jgi:hypothetical protein
MITLEEYGVPLTQQMGTFTADTSIASDDDAYSIKIYMMAYDSGGTTYQPVLGDLIIGATSSATGIVLSCSLDSGTWAGGDGAGVIYMYNVSGTWQNDEVFNVVKAKDSSAVADEGTVNGVAWEVQGIKSFKAPNGQEIYNGQQAKVALLEATANPIRVTLDGTPPTPGTLTNGLVSRGLYIEANEILVIRGVTSVKNIKLCNANASANAAYRIVYYF